MKMITNDNYFRGTKKVEGLSVTKKDYGQKKLQIKQNYESFGGRQPKQEKKESWFQEKVSWVKGIFSCKDKESVQTNEHSFRDKQYDEVNLRKESQKKQFQEILELLDTKIIGIRNVGFSCYMSSILQCLLNLGQFNLKLLEYLQEFNQQTKQQVSLCYAQIIYQFYDQITNQTSYKSYNYYHSWYRSLDPSQLKKAVQKQKTRFEGYEQQDAHQFLITFLQLVNQQLSRVNQPPQYKELETNPQDLQIKKLSDSWWDYEKLREDSIICDIFQGQTISKFKCYQCRNLSVTFSNFWTLHLDFYNQNSQYWNQPILSIYQLIQKNWNTSNTVNNYYCKHCKKIMTGCQTVNLFRMPKILIIYLKRFQQDRDGRKYKKYDQVRISRQLNLNEIISPDARKNQFKYKLKGVVNHRGILNSGHYTAKVCKNKPQRWQQANDSSIYQDQLQIQSYYAYVLFYQKVQSFVFKQYKS